MVNLELQKNTREELMALPHDDSVKLWKIFGAEFPPTHIAIAYLEGTYASVVSHVTKMDNFYNSRGHYGFISPLFIKKLIGE